MRECCSGIALSRGELFWKAFLDESPHHLHFELVEGYASRVVCVEPVEHSVKQLFWILVRVLHLAELLNQAHAHRLDFFHVEIATAILVCLVECFSNELGEHLSLLLEVFLFLLRGLVDEVVELQSVSSVHTDDLSRRCLQYEADSLRKSSLDFNVHRQLNICTVS